MPRHGDFPSLELADLAELADALKQVQEKDAPSQAG